MVNWVNSDYQHLMKHKLQTRRRQIFFQHRKCFCEYEASRSVVKSENVARCLVEESLHLNRHDSHKKKSGFAIWFRSKILCFIVRQKFAFNMFEYSGALAAWSRCSSGSGRRPNSTLPQLSRACCRICTSPSRRTTTATRTACAYRPDSASRSDNSRRFWCKQECSLPTVFPSWSARCHNRFWSSFYFPAQVSCRWSFSRTNICSSVASGTFARLRDTFSPQTRTSQACWCHHLRKLRDTHETLSSLCVLF